MSDQRRTPLAAIIAGGVSVVLAVVLALVYFLGVRPHYELTADEISRATPLTRTENQVVDAASIEAANLLSLRHDHFDADWARALAATTGKLRAYLATKTEQVRKPLETGKFDTVAATRTSALVWPTSGGRYAVMVMMASPAEAMSCSSECLVAAISP